VQPRNRSLKGYDKVDRILTLLEDVKRVGNGWQSKCPAHDDDNPSLSISLTSDSKVLLKCHAGCETEEVVKALGLKMKDLFPNRRSKSSSSWKRVHNCTPKKQNTESTKKDVVHKGLYLVNQNHTGAHLTLVEYAKDKGLPVKFLVELGLHDQIHLSQKRIVIPYYDKDNKEIARRYRTRNPNGKKVTFWRKGDNTCLYGLWRLDRDNPPDFMVLCEGESDCQTLWHKGFPALGLPGANNWKDDRDAPLENAQTIYVIREPDSGGEAMEKWLTRSAIKDRAKIVFLDGYSDPSDLYLADPENFAANFQLALDSAVPWGRIEAERKEAERRDSWEKCKDLATDDSILNVFTKCLRRCGLVGEEQAAKLLYLSLVTRLFQRPTSVVIDGPSSAGKSFLAATVLKFFPTSAYHDLSAMSEKNLAYTEEPLSNRFLVLYEAAGLGGEFATYLIRSLLSEGRIKYEYVEKGPEGLRSRRIEKEGPTGLLMTTTSVWLHSENETRLLTVTVNDTKEQTEAIFIALAEETKDEVDFEAWHALQEWLQAGGRRVVVPFAIQLARLTKAVAVRLRRDFNAVLSLIKAHALLHQATRERDSSRSVIATLEDYAVVRDLAGNIVAHCVEATVRETVRETVQTVKLASELSKEEYVSIKDIAAELNLDRSAASRRVATAIRHGYLKNLEDKKGKPKRIALADPLPEDEDIFPTLEELTNLCIHEKAASPYAQPKTVEIQELSDGMCSCASVEWEKDLTPSFEYCSSKYESDICPYFDVKNKCCYYHYENPVLVTELENCLDETTEPGRA
jgi:DNA-binding MarR family transcriptional regulator